jgi:ATP/maltotriose-dependent transcriptional regulator MalT
LRPAITTLERTPGHDPEELADADWLVGQMLYDAGEYREAESYARDSYNLRHSAQPQGHNTLLSALTLAALWLHLGRADDADALLREVSPAIEQTDDGKFRVLYREMWDALHGDRRGIKG